MTQKNWRHLGEVTKKDRPVDSLLKCDIDFDQQRPHIAIAKDTEAILQKIVQRRLKEKDFDNFIQKKEDVFLQDDSEASEVSDDNLTKEEMTDLFWVVDNELSKMSDFGGTTIGVLKDEKVFEEKKKKTKKIDEDVKNLKKNKNVKFL